MQNSTIITLRLQHYTYILANQMQPIEYHWVSLNIASLFNKIMEKYRVYEKIAKTKGHSFFRAENTETRENVVVKKLHHETTWEEILKNKNISLMNNNKIKSIATIREIVKDQQTFYCVF